MLLLTELRTDHCFNAEHLLMARNSKRRERKRRRKSRKFDHKKLNLKVKMKRQRVVDGNRLKVESMLQW
jgi:hypothetical protein